MFTTEDAVKSSATVDPITGFLYVGSHDQHAYALDIYVRIYLIGLITISVQEHETVGCSSLEEQVLFS